MAFAATVETFLKQHAVPFRTVEHPVSFTSKDTADATHISAHNIAKAVVVGDDRGYIMAIVPGNRYVDLHKLSEMTKRKLGLVDEVRLATVFKDCEQGAIPPVGPAYHMETVVDEDLVGHEKIWFVPGDHSLLVAVDGGDFVQLLGQTRFGRFSH